GIADATGDGTGVDAADANDVLTFEALSEVTLCAVVGDDSGGVAHDEAVDPDALRLVVLAVHPRVADVGRRHDDDLARVGGIGDRLLVSGHAGREDRLAQGRAAGAVGTSRVSAAVL